jgi:hypothetical protein
MGACSTTAAPWPARARACCWPRTAACSRSRRQRRAAEAGLGVTTIGKIEDGVAVMVGDWQQKVCDALKVPTWLLTVPVKRWVGVVNGSGLSARHAVPAEGGGE